MRQQDFDSSKGGILSDYNLKIAIVNYINWQLSCTSGKKRQRTLRKDLFKLMMELETTDNVKAFISINNFKIKKLKMRKYDGTDYQFLIASQK